MGGSRSPQREPIQTWGEHANPTHKEETSTQKLLLWHNTTVLPGDILISLFFFFFFKLIQAGFVSMVTLKNYRDWPQWVKNISINPFLFCLFVFLSHFLKDHRRKKEKIWERWSGQSEDNSIFTFTLLATEEEFPKKNGETRDRQKTPWMKYIWTFLHRMNMQHAWLQFHPEQ